MCSPTATKEGNVCLKSKKGLQSKKGKMDPAKKLNEACLFHVFSFVGGKLAAGLNGNEADNDIQDEITNEDSAGLCISEAFTYYELLASVSRGWKVVLDRHFCDLASDLCVNFEVIPTELLDFFTEWTCIHQLRIKSILCYSSECQKAASRILQECQTTQLTLAAIVIEVNDNEEEESTATISSSDAEAEKDKEKTIPVQESLAQNCPMLHTLCFQLIVNQNELGSDVMNPALFSLPSVRNLVVSVDVASNCALEDEMIFSRLIQNFPNLQKLEIDSNQDSFCERSNPVIFHIASPTLQSLYVPSLCANFVYLSLDCPSLRLFVCAGDPSPEDPNLLRLKQTVLSAETVPGDCMGAIRQADSDEEPLESFQFHNLLGYCMA